MSLSAMTFFKFQGTGNDFLITWIDADAPSPFNSQNVKTLCDRHFGLGADGLVALKEVPQDPTDKGRTPEFRWDFYNSDGSVAAMCGNAARCVGLFVLDQRGVDHLNLFTKSGPVSIRTNKDSLVVEVQLKKPSFVSESPFVLIDSGVPHIIVHDQNLDAFNMKALRPKALEIRSHKDFPKNGANITFLSPIATGNIIKSVTYERGVNDFTLSCGTGALAAAFFCEMKSPSQSAWIVNVPGGELQVVFNDTKALLTGSATKVAELKVFNI